MFLLGFLQPLSFELFARRVVPLCVAAVLLAVLRNFILAREAGPVERERASFVATGSMTAFCVVFYLVIRAGVRTGFGVVPVHGLPRSVLILLGLLLIVAGTVTNILGRLSLGRNWANQATVYREQTLVTEGVFGLVRHPLYAGLIWMLLGASLIYLNIVALLTAALIFVPMMHHRARIEEVMLEERFPEYADYRKRVGMFYPKGLLGQEIVGPSGRSEEKP